MPSKEFRDAASASTAAPARALARAPRMTARARTPVRAKAGSKCFRTSARRTPASSKIAKQFILATVGRGVRGRPFRHFRGAKAMISGKPPYLGFGLGLRPQHYREILDGCPAVDWFEIISENYMIEGGQPLYMLDRICERYPVVMHGVSLSIASTAPFDFDYLGALKKLAERVNPKWISDHLCWTGVHGVNLHDLLPIPYTQEALDHVVERVGQVQDFLGRRLTLENVSSYV